MAENLQGLRWCYILVMQNWSCPFYQVATSQNPSLFLFEQQSRALDNCQLWCREVSLEGPWAPTLIKQNTQHLDQNLRFCSDAWQRRAPPSPSHALQSLGSQGVHFPGNNREAWWGDQLRKQFFLWLPEAKPNMTTHKTESQHPGPHLNGFLTFSNWQPSSLLKTLRDTKQVIWAASGKI